MHMFEIDEGGEYTWVVAQTEADALQVYREEMLDGDQLPEDAKATRLNGHKKVTVQDYETDGSDKRQSCAAWVGTFARRGVLCSTAF